MTDQPTVEKENVIIEDEEMPELEDAVQQPDVPSMDEMQHAAHAAGSRIDKKTKKAFARMGLHPYDVHVHRVTLRQGRTTFSIDHVCILVAHSFRRCIIIEHTYLMLLPCLIFQPEVFKGTGETYVVIGEPKLDDSTASQRAAIQQLLQQQQFLAQQQAASGAEESKIEEAEDITETAGETGETVDESSVDEGDIDLVLASAPQGTTRAQAVKALLEKGNPVDAVLMLSSE